MPARVSAQPASVNDDDEPQIPPPSTMGISAAAATIAGGAAAAPAAGEAAAPGIDAMGPSSRNVRTSQHRRLLSAVLRQHVPPGEGADLPVTGDRAGHDEARQVASPSVVGWLFVVFPDRDGLIPQAARARAWLLATVSQPATVGITSR